MVKVSILMPAFNAAKYIKESIQSVLNQTFSDWELVIVNDGSTDKTEEIVKTFRDSRIRYIKNEKNTGLGPVRNQLLALAQGAYIAWLDADDIALPQRLLAQACFLDKHSDFALVGAWVKLIDEHGKKTGAKWKNRTKADDMPSALFFWNQFTQSSVMIRKDDLPFPIYRGEYAPAEEYDLWIRIAENKKLTTLPCILAEYRVLPKSASHGSNAQELAREKILKSNLARLGIMPTEEEYMLHRTNFGYSGTDTEFLKKRETWLLKLVEANLTKKVFDALSFQKITGERWLASCRANSRGLKTWRECWHSSLAVYISRTERWRDIAKFALEALFRSS